MNINNKSEKQLSEHRKKTHWQLWSFNPFFHIEKRVLKKNFEFDRQIDFILSILLPFSILN